jgi:hypothetical protein
MPIFQLAELLNMLGTFLVPNEKFTARQFAISGDPQAEDAKVVLPESISPVSEIVVTETSRSVTITGELHGGEHMMQAVLEETTTHVEVRPTEELPVVADDGDVNKELEQLQKPRSIFDVMAEKRPSTSHSTPMIDALLEATFGSTEAILATRLAYIKQVSDLVKENDTLANVILDLGERFAVVLPMDRVIGNEIVAVNIPVTKDGVFNATEIALISVYLRRKMDKFPQTEASLNQTISKLEYDAKFKDGLITSLRNKIQTLEAVKPAMVTAFIIKRQGRERYLYVEGKEIKSSRTVSHQTLYATYEDAEKALIYAIKHRNRTMVKKVMTYQIVQLSHFEPLSPTPLLLEALKKAAR